MLSSMTLAEIQAKYSGIHTPEDIEQFHQNMTNSKKWKIVKNEWTWDGLNHVQLRGRALQYHPNLDMVELYKEHPPRAGQPPQNHCPELRGGGGVLISKPNVYNKNLMQTRT